MFLEDVLSVVSCPVTIMCVDASRVRGESQSDSLLASCQKHVRETINQWRARRSGAGRGAAERGGTVRVFRRHNRPVVATARPWAD